MHASDFKFETLFDLRDHQFITIARESIGPLPSCWFNPPLPRSLSTMAEKTLSCERSSILNKSSVAVARGSNIAASGSSRRLLQSARVALLRTHEGSYFTAVYICGAGKGNLPHEVEQLYMRLREWEGCNSTQPIL